jgi:hypothetical protein
MISWPGSGPTRARDVYPRSQPYFPIHATHHKRSLGARPEQLADVDAYGLLDIGTRPALSTADAVYRRYAIADHRDMRVAVETVGRLPVG